MSNRIAPTALLAAIARQATPTVRTVAVRAPAAWRTDGAAYAVTRPVSGHAPTLRGDGRTLVNNALAQVDLWEPAAVADDNRVVALADALDGARLDTGHVGHLEDTRLVDEPDSDEVHHALTIRYRLPLDS